MGFFDVVANIGTLGGASLMGQNSDQQAQTAQYMGNPDLSQFGANPYSSSLAESLKNMPGYSPISAQLVTAQSVTAPGSIYQSGPAFQYDAYKAKDMSTAAMPQYEAMRARLNSQYSQNQGQAQDAIDRQFAAMGGGPGGAQIKQTENLAASTERQKGQDLEGIGAQEAQARQDLQNQENQKEFQSGETGKGFGFQANQADITRRQAADESAAGRQFQAGEFNAGATNSLNEFNAGATNSLNQFNAQMQQNQNQFQFQAGATIAGLNTSWDQAQAESRNNEFNKQIADRQARYSGGMLGGGGFLGSGIGAGGFST